jgi:hypothetical protein
MISEERLMGEEAPRISQIRIGKLGVPAIYTIEYVRATRKQHDLLVELLSFEDFIRVLDRSQHFRVVCDPGLTLLPCA